MALKVELKPHERIVIGNVVIRNGETRGKLFIEGKTAIMREKDILTASEANSPARRIYFVLQLMYLDNNIAPHRAAFLELIEDFMSAAPSAWPHINAITNCVLAGDIYKAIKATKKLIEFETERMGYELRNECLCEDGAIGDHAEAIGSGLTDDVCFPA